MQHSIFITTMVVHSIPITKLYVEVCTFWSSLCLPTPYYPTSSNYQYLGIWAWIFFFFFLLFFFLIFYGEIFVEICCPFIKIIVSLLSFERSSCILDKKNYIKYMVCKYFSKGLHQAKFGIKSNFSIFSFIDCTFNVVAKNGFQYPRSLKCSPIFFRIF